MSGLSIFWKYRIYHNKNVRKYEHLYKIPQVKGISKPEIISNLLDNARKKPEELFSNFKSSVFGLTSQEAKNRIYKFGLNEVTHEKREPWTIRLIKSIAHPLIILFLFLIAVSLITRDIRTAVVIGFIVFVSVALGFYQENQAYNSSESLQSMVKTTCTVIRNNMKHEIDLKRVVPGDIVDLSAGDIVPADLRLLESKELFVNQSVLTGESLPVEKHATLIPNGAKNPLELTNACFMGTNVESGHATGIVLQTGINTYFGSLASSIVGQREITSFDKGIDRFTWLMIAFMAFMVPTVFLINGLTKGNWLEAFLFGISVAVGLTLEMLPAIVTVNLSKGAIVMSKKKVIVKRLNAIQNFGAMNILCTDKTGTLTQNRIVLINNVNIKGNVDMNVLHFAYINSFFQTGFKNLLDSSILKHAKKNQLNSLAEHYKKIDELPFDFKRKRLSVVVDHDEKGKILICKGALEEILSICSHYELDGITFKIKKEDQTKIQNMYEQYSKDGFRIVAVGYKPVEKTSQYSRSDEDNLIFLGMMTFFDPPKESAVLAISQLKRHGIDIRILTGDNELVTRKVAQEVGLTATNALLAPQIDEMNDEELQQSVESTTIFAKLSPEHKKRIIQALQQNSHVVGFLGDGINDAPGLRSADVGISVNSAVDIAKESADIILLEMSLTVLSDGVIEGRKVFGNIIKYIKMGASSNFGNMFSVLGASIFLPFLPMRPAQLLVNNLLYDMSQTAIPTDLVDKEYIQSPRKWRINDIGRFMIFIGPISSIFDYVTFFMMLYIFRAWKNPMLFQTGWFIESLITQTLIVHVIRSRKIPFLQTWASKPLIFTTLLIVSIGIFLTLSPFAHYFAFVRLPSLYWPLLVIILTSYILLTQLVKSWYIRKFGYN